MKILVVDAVTENQAHIAGTIDAFDPADKDRLNITIFLSSHLTYEERIRESDVVILGPGLKENGSSIAHKIKQVAPEVEILLFIPDADYSSVAFRGVHISSVRKVFTWSASPFDLLQELIRVHGGFKVLGRVVDGRLIIVTQAKGGVGATTFAAALGELTSLEGKNTLLWDLDIETQDLSRSISSENCEREIVSQWIRHEESVTKGSLRSATVDVTPTLSILACPESVAESTELIGQLSGMQVIDKIAGLSCSMFDVTIVDTGGRIGPGAGALIRMADIVLVVVDDSILGLSALPTYLTKLQKMMGSHGIIRIVCSGTKSSSLQIASELRDFCDVTDIAADLPTIPLDTNAERWPGTGGTIYSHGARATRAALEGIAFSLGLKREPTASTVVTHERKQNLNLSNKPIRSSNSLRGLLQRLNVGALLG